MNRFVVSDTHFYHYNIIEHEGRPFESEVDMNNQLINNWNQVVGEKDVVYHLGDIALASHDEIVELCEQLNGRIMLVKGNHDDENISEYNFPYPYVESMTLHHYGYRYYCSHKSSDIPQEWKHWKIVGHQHSNIPFINYQKKQVNVSVDVTGFYPIPIEMIHKCLKSMNNKSRNPNTIHESNISDYQWYHKNIN